MQSLDQQKEQLYIGMGFSSKVRSGTMECPLYRNVPLLLVALSHTLSGLRYMVRDKDSSKMLNGSS